ncbi:MAG: hypothetical protein WKF97_16065 [Chitinophagaceae bacterium]
MEISENNGITPDQTNNGNDDQSSDSSIGSGTSDQGIEPGEEEEEDEFRKNISGSSPVAGFIDETNADGSQRGNDRPSKGLVEEGPGPDS